MHCRIKVTYTEEMKMMQFDMRLTKKQNREGGSVKVV